MSLKAIKGKSEQQTRSQDSDGAHPDVTCLQCAHRVAWVTASTYGGRCGACYAQHCNEHRPPPPHTGTKKDPLSWAFALKARHEAGERLTKAQIDAYVAALRLTGPVPRAPRHDPHHHHGHHHHDAHHAQQHVGDAV